MAQYSIHIYEQLIKTFMKKKLSILMIPFLLMEFSGYCQDSVRTRNDKPGTPQSLRTANSAPQSQVNIINNNTVPNQAIDHGATESSQVGNTSGHTNGAIISQTPTTTINKDTGNAGNTFHTDTTKLRRSNITSPIRK